MRRLFHTATAYHSLCKVQCITLARNVYFKLQEYNIIRCYSSSSPLTHSTEVSDELLSNFHPFQQLLKETISKSLLNR